MAQLVRCRPVVSFGFDPSPVHVVDKVPMGKVLFPSSSKILFVLWLLDPFASHGLPCFLMAVTSVFFHCALSNLATSFRLPFSHLLLDFSAGLFSSETSFKNEFWDSVFEHPYQPAHFHLSARMYVTRSVNTGVI